MDMRRTHTHASTSLKGATSETLESAAVASGRVMSAVLIVAAAGFAVLWMIVVALLLPAGARAVPGETTTTIVLEGEVKEQVDALQAQAAQVRTEIDDLDTELEILAEDYNALQIQLEDINGDLHKLRSRLHETQEAYDYRRQQVEDRIVETYKSGGDTLLQILLATDDFTSFVKRLVLIYHINTEDQRVVDGLDVSIDDIALLESQIRDKKDEGVALRQELDAKQVEIESTLANRQATLAGLDVRVAEIIEQERQRQEEERRRLEEALRAQLTGWDLYTGPLPQIDDVILSQLVETAATYLGVPYVWAGEHPSTGMDCSGFTRYVYLQHGINLPHYSGFQAQMGVPVPPSEITAGDLLAFGHPVHHVGIYIGDGLYMHAPRTGDVIKISRLADRRDVNTIRRFPVLPRSGPPLID